MQSERRSQSDAVGALACARRRNDVIRRGNGTEMAPHGASCANMTSYIKPEVRGVSQRYHHRDAVTSIENLA